MKDTDVNHDRLKEFRERLDTLNISDYHGLDSPGLTCYLNSVLQVLFMTEDFRAAIKRSCRNSPATIDSLLGELFTDLERGLARTARITKRLGIDDVLEQRDAAEYLEKILSLTSPEATEMMKGKLQHEITCLSCQSRSQSRSFFWILPLAMDTSQQKTYTVERGLQAFFKREKVSGKNMMFCNQCYSKQEAHIKCDLTRNPEILTLLLKRFAYDCELKRYVKLHRPVDVPQTLHLKSCSYDLYAVVKHYGTLTGGHYTAEIRSFETGEWYCFNDDVVEKVKPLFDPWSSTVRSDEAYLLMYRKERTSSESSDSERSREGGRDEAGPPRPEVNEGHNGGENTLTWLRKGLRRNDGDSFEGEHGVMDVLDPRWMQTNAKQNGVSSDRARPNPSAIPKPKHGSDRGQRHLVLRGTNIDNPTSLCPSIFSPSQTSDTGVQRSRSSSSTGSSEKPLPVFTRVHGSKKVPKKDTVKHPPWR